MRKATDNIDVRKVMIAAVYLFFTAAGCYKSADVEPPWEPPDVDLGGDVAVSGSRLQARVWVSDDGVDIATGTFLDTVLGEPCRFEEAREGGYRCFPINVATVGIHGVLYADASCDKQVFVLSETTGQPAGYIADNGPDGCAGRKLYEVGERITEDARMAPDCTFTMSGTAGAALKGEAVPDSRFVRAEEVLIGDGVPLGRQLTAEDGTAVMLGFYDAEADAPCSPYGTAQGWRCLTEPSSGMYSWSGQNVFEGVECWDAVLAWSGCEPPVYGINDKSEDAAFYELIPAGEATGLSAGIKACLEQAATWTVAPLYVFGDEVPSTRFPALSVVEHTTRVTGTAWTNSDSSAALFRESIGGLYDRELDRPCWIRAAADGEYRCLPSSRFLTDWSYADPQCTVPLFSLRLFEEEAEREAESPEPLPLLVALYGDSRGRNHVADFGEPYTGESYRRVQSGSESICTPESELSGGGPSEPLITASAEHPPEGFARYEKVWR